MACKRTAQILIALLGVAAASEEAACFANGTCPSAEADNAALLQSKHHQAIRRHGNHAAARMAATCEQGAHVPCPGSGNMCAGDQCCPGTATSNGRTFPCPSANHTFARCESNVKLEDCLEPQACCKAMNAKCLSCAAGVSEEEYCQQNPTTVGCPPQGCCMAMTADCLACSAGMTVEEYCQQNPTTAGCQPQACCMAMTADCLACSAGMTVEEYCQQNPTMAGCQPQGCCMAMTADCLACSAGMTVEEYCQQNPTMAGCQPQGCCMAMTADCLACSAGMTVEEYCQQNPTTTGCPPQACCRAMTADCLACSAGLTVEEYCQQNPTTVGCYQPETCSQGQNVPCPGSGNMCMGNQCCPGTEMSGGQTFPCPSASQDFQGCASNTKLANCVSA